MRDLLLLRLRDAIAEKEWIIAQANRQTALDGWLCDWPTAMDITNAQIAGLVESIHTRGE